MRVPRSRCGSSVSTAQTICFASANFLMASSCGSLWQPPSYSGWERRKYNEESGAVHDDSDDEVVLGDMSPEECSTEFFNFLVHLKICGTLSAKQACLLSYWAKRGGLCNPGASLAMPPSRSGGSFSRHFDKVVGLDKKMEGDFYKFEMPAIERWSLGRTSIVCHANVVYKQLRAEIDAIDDFDSLLEKTSATEGWGLKYNAHPLVRSEAAAGQLVVPLAMYLDGVPFQKRDSALGLWLINLVTGRRFLVMALRKRQYCRCGCKAWCSLDTAFRVLEWMLYAMVKGTHPSHRHDGSSWPDADPNSNLGGSPLGFKAVVLFIKGDWAEFATSMGYFSWKHHKHPCFACACTGGPGGNIMNHDGVSALGLPWPPKLPEHYEEACQNAEVRVTVSSHDQLQRLLGHLEYDRRPNGSHGRSLAQDFAPLRLNKGDRLEPSEYSPDVGRIEEISTFPHDLVFWRVSCESICKHRHPLFHPRSMIGSDALVVDELHTLHLGVFANYVVHTLWQLIDADAWNLGSSLPPHVLSERSALCIRDELFTWYAQQKRDHPKKPLYELADFSLYVLGGSRDHPVLKAKAAETGTLLNFAVDLSIKFQHKLDRATAVIGAGQALQSYMRITRGAPGQLSPGQRQGLIDAALKHLNLREAAGIPWKPKLHLFLHLVAQAQTCGNPLELGTWHDESLNRQLAQVASTAHAAVWHKRILATFSHASGPTHQPPKKRRV